MELAKRIKKIRMEKGFSQEFVAEKMGISQSAYSKMEARAGNCTFYTLEKIATVLKVSVPYMLDIRDEYQQQ